MKLNFEKFSCLVGIIFYSIIISMITTLVFIMDDMDISYEFANNDTMKFTSYLLFGFITFLGLSVYYLTTGLLRFKALQKLTGVSR